jgi:hypothetical protein
VHLFRGFECWFTLIPWSTLIPQCVITYNSNCYLFLIYTLSWWNSFFNAVSRARLGFYIVGSVDAVTKTRQGIYIYIYTSNICLYVYIYIHASYPYQKPFVPPQQHLYLFIYTYIYIYIYTYTSRDWWTNPLAWVHNQAERHQYKSTCRVRVNLLVSISHFIKLHFAYSSLFIFLNCPNFN